MHRLEAGHFIVEDHLDYIETHIRRFYAQRVAAVTRSAMRGDSTATAAD